jgi:hypothetical protein
VGSPRNSRKFQIDNCEPSRTRGDPRTIQGQAHNPHLAPAVSTAPDQTIAALTSPYHTHQTLPDHTRPHATRPGYPQDLPKIRRGYTPRIPRIPEHFPSRNLPIAEPSNCETSQLRNLVHSVPPPYRALTMSLLEAGSGDSPGGGSLEMNRND